MDLIMPHMNGLEATRQIRTNLKLTDIPIIALTTQTTIDDVQNAFSCGITDFLVKPFHPHQLIERINVWLELVDSN